MRRITKRKVQTKEYCLLDFRNFANLRIGRHKEFEFFDIDYVDIPSYICEFNFVPQQKRNFRCH